LLEIEGMTPEKFRHCSGFLRIAGGDEPLDNTAVHPDDYELVRRLAANRGVTPADLIGNKDTSLRPDDATDDATRALAAGVLHVLSRAGADPRGELQAAANEGISTIGQLQNQMRLMGRVTNVTDFGAFIDVGVGQDGLVHISQIHGSRRHEDNPLRVGETIEVFVLGVDLEKRKISLSMFRPRVEGGEERRGGRGRGAGGGKRGEREGGGGREGHRGRTGRVGGGAGRGNRERGGDRPYGDRDRGPRRSGPPRVITVESGKPVEDAVGHKGELTSLSGLKALLKRNEPAQDN